MNAGTHQARDSNPFPPAHTSGGSHFMNPFPILMFPLPMKPLPNPFAIRTYNANGTASVQRLTGTAPNPFGIHSLPSAPVLCRYSWYSSTILRSVLPPSASLLPGLRFWLLIYHAFCKFRQLSHHTSTILLHRNPSIIRTLPNITPCGTLHSGGILNFPRGTPPDVFCSVSLHKKRPRRGEAVFVFASRLFYAA